MHAPRSSEIAQLTLVECSQKDLHVYSVSMLLAGMAKNTAHGGNVLCVLCAGFVYELTTKERKVCRVLAHISWFQITVSDL